MTELELQFFEMAVQRLAHATTVEPIFGEDAGRHRHTGVLPPSGLGTALRQLAIGAGGDFNEREMAVVRAAAARRRGAPEPNFEIVGPPVPPPASSP